MWPQTRKNTWIFTESSLMSLKRLLRDVRACRICEAELPLGPRPVVQLASGARLLIVGQAPGSKVHRSGIPWNDASGDRLRDWLGLDRATFFDEAKVAILPMGFCLPWRRQERR
jgi:uracil-DNA glycosylase